MSVWDYDGLRQHIGHKVACVCYGKDGEDPVNVAVECEDCGSVLFSFDKDPPDEPTIKNKTDLLLNIAHGLNKHDTCKISDLEVVLLEDGEEVLRAGVATALDYLANDIYWNEESDWRNANLAEVRVL